MTVVITVLPGLHSVMTVTAMTMGHVMAPSVVMTKHVVMMTTIMTDVGQAWRMS